MNIKSCAQASRAAEQERIARVRAELLLRGGRFVKFKGILASIGPSMTGVSLVVAVASLAAVPSTSFAGDCTAGTTSVCSAPADAGADATQVFSGSDVSVTTTPGFGLEVASGNAITVNTTNGFSFDDPNGSSITGNLYGIEAVNNTSGDLVIRSTGDITGDNWDAIAATNGAGTGDLIIEAADLTGGRRGVEARHNGTGALTVNVSGTITSVWDGVVAETSASSTGGITVNVNEIVAQGAGGNGAGIYTVDRGTGDTSITATGAVSSAQGNGIHAVTSASAGSVTINATDVTANDRGIFIQHNGTGAVDVTAGDLYAEGIDGIRVDTTANGTGGVTIDVQNAHGVGYSGIALYDNSDGDANITVAGEARGDGQYGIFVSAGSQVDNVSVQTGTAHGGGLDGIYVAHSGTGNVDISANGTVSAGRDGIVAVAGANTVDLSIDAQDINAGRFGVNIAGGSSTGDTSVTTGNIQAGTGVVYGRNSTGKVSITTGDITATAGNGIQFGVELLTNDLIINAGDITATARGITGNTHGRLDFANITTINVGNITSGSDGIDIIHSGTGAATINATGTIQSGGVGVSLINDSRTFFPPAPDSETIITVNNIDTPNNTAIYVNSNAVKGTTITTTGAINTPAAGFLPGDGMRVIEHHGPLVVNVAQGSTITSFNNAMDLTNNGTAGTTINVDGTLRSTALGGGVDGVIWMWGTPGTTTVNINDGSTVQAADRTGFAMTDHGGDSVINVGAATMTGGFRLGAGDDALTFNGTDMTNVGTLNGGAGSTGGDVLTLNAVQNFTRNLQTAGQEIQNWDAVNLNGGTADLVGTLTTGAFTLGEDGNGNPATLSIGANNVGDTLTVTGDYVGAGGTILLDVDASTHTSDQLVVDGNVSGVTGLAVNNLTPTGAAADEQDIAVVDVRGTSSPGDAFVLAYGPAQMGGRAYQLQQGDSAGANPMDWFLTLQACPAGGLNETNGTSLGCITDDTLTVNGTEVFAGNFEGAGGMDILTVAGGASVGGIVAGGEVGADASAEQDGADLIVINTTGSVGGVQGNLGDDVIYVVGGSSVVANVEGNEGSNQIRIGGLGALPDGSVPAADTVTVGGDVLGGDGAATDGNNQIWVLGGAHVAGRVVGGNGNDTIVLNGATAAVDGAIEGGEGNDTIALMQGTVASVDGGAGNDNIGLSGAVVSGAIDAGDGNNIVTLSAGSAGSVSAGAGVDTITLSGAAISGAINSGAGNDIIHLTSGTVAGGVNAGAGADTLNVAGATFTLGNTRLDGGAAGEGNTLNLNSVNQTLIAPQSNLVNWDTVNANSSTLTVGGGDSLTAAQVNLINSTIVARSGFTINGNLSLNPATIDMQDDAAGDTFNVTGNYAAVGSGNTLKIDANFATDVADELHVGGSVTGVTALNVKDLTPVTAEATGQDVLVATAGGSVDASNFSLVGGPIVNGIWDYDLANGAAPKTVVLRGGLNSLGALYSGAAGALADAFGELPTLEERVGQRQWLAGGNDSAFGGLWVRMSGGQTTKTPKSSTVDFTTRNDTWGVQVGADFALLDNDEGGRLSAGVTGQYKGMDARITRPEVGDRGKISADGAGVGVNLTWNSAGGEYVDFQAQYNKASADLGTTSHGTTVNGLDVESTSVSLEAGNRFVIGEGRKSVLVPQAQVSWSQLSSDTFTDSKGVQVDLGNHKNNVARIGLAYEYHANGANLTGPDNGGKMFYAIVNVVQSLKPHHTTIAQNMELLTSDQPTWVEVGVGGSIALGSNALLYGQATYGQSEKNASDNHGVGGTVGVRWDF